MLYLNLNVGFHERMLIQFLVLSISNDILQFVLLRYLNGMSKKIFFAL
jgi:hypothetical protein